MNKKTYKRLMLAGIVPWRADALKKPRRITDADKLARDGWLPVSKDGVLNWRGRDWTLLYKVVSPKPRHLPGFDPVPPDAYHYVEFMAVGKDGRAELYAYGNFLRGESKPYLMRGRQVVRVDDGHKP